MKNCNLRSVSVLLTAAILVAAFGGATAHAQYYGTQTSGARSPAASQQPTVIQIHHHHYYQPTGPTPIIAQQSDPGYAGSAWLGGPPSPSMEPMPWERNWGELGFHAYLAQKGGYSGLIVSKVFPDTPASKLALAAGDVIINVNGQVVNDLSMRQLEILFLGLTTEEKQAVNMQVWNSNSGRMSTLKAVFEDKAVKAFQDDALDDE